MEQIRKRIDTAKTYVKENAPTIVAATAAVATALTVKNLRQDLRRARELQTFNEIRATDVIKDCIKEERDFTYMPGIGVYVHATDNPTEDN